MKKNRRETLIVAFEMSLAVLSTMNLITYAFGNGCDHKAVKLQSLYELCLDELRKDKPNEDVLKSFQNKIELLSNQS